MALKKFPAGVALWSLHGALLLMAGCSTLPPAATFPRVESHALPPRLAILGASTKLPAPSTEQSNFSMVANGVDGLAARLELIGAAKESLDLQYYIFRADISGMLVAKALLNAADRGVRVRVLVDEGESVAGDERLFALAAHPSIQFRVFNPFDYRGHNRVGRALDFVLHKKRLDHRMHNKLMIADNAIGLIGGRNVGDQYFQISPDSQFGDDDVVAEGPVVPQLSHVFDTFWNDPISIPIQGLEPAHASVEALAAFRAAAPAVRVQNAFDKDLAQRMALGEPLAGVVDGRTRLTSGTAQVVYDSPSKAKVSDGGPPGNSIYAALESRAAAVQSELLMITPYLVPTQRQLKLLQEIRGRGVTVQALTNSLEAAPDVTAHAGYARYRPAFLEAGVELFEIRAQVDSAKGTGQPKKLSRHGNYALHAKLYVFDRRALFVGSMNFDQRSQNLNTEIGLLIDNPEMAASAATRFEALTQPSNAYSVRLSEGDAGRRGQLVWTTERDGVPTTQSVEPARSGWQRFKLRVLELAPIDKEL